MTPVTLDEIERGEYFCRVDDADRHPIDTMQKVLDGSSLKQCATCYHIKQQQNYLVHKTESVYKVKKVDGRFVFA